MHQSGVKLSILVGALTAAVLVGAYVYSLWATESKKRDDLPVEAVSVMIRDLRRYHEKRGGFPATLRDLEGTVWQPKPRDLTPDGLGLHSRNYFYLYGRSSDYAFTLWAIPTGTKREEAATWFVSASPDSCRKWKGAAIDIDQLSLLGGTNDASLIGLLGLIEQPSISTEPFGGIRFERTRSVWIR